MDIGMVGRITLKPHVPCVIVLSLCSWSNAVGIKAYASTTCGSTTCGATRIMPPCNLRFHMFRQYQCMLILLSFVQAMECPVGCDLENFPTVFSTIFKLWALVAPPMLFPPL